MFYRAVLYSNYSSSFGEQKAFVPEVQFEVYEAHYGTQPLARDAVVLDVGCGKGEWLAWLHQRGHSDLHGVDASESDIAIARQTTPSATLTLGDATELLSRSENSFDLIHAKDVVEHMSKDEFIAFLQAAHRALRPGGRIWLLTFNAQAPLAGATRYGDFTHESGHTPLSFSQCFRACGFTDVTVRGIHYCSRSLGGRVRAVMASAVHAVARLMLRLRHGGGSRQAAVDLFAAEPDLFAQATKA
jgi:cyclopropane fatty-acyl-phospholipid synthase-like methyltransferase